ncbi:hypothetical protein Tco_0818919 [Tanacetum coccineum]
MCIVELTGCPKRKFVIIVIEKGGLASEYTDDILAYSNSEGGTKVSFEVSVESLMNEKPDAKFSKSNVVGDALSRKERVKSRRMERKGDDSLYLMDRMWVLLVGNVMDEARASRYLVHLGADKTYYNLGYMIGSHCAPFEALYGRKCRSPVLWAEIKESSLTGLEVVQETTDKEVLIKEKPKAVRDRQKSYADNRRKPLEFEVGDRVLLRVSPCKGIVRFGKNDKQCFKIQKKQFLIENDRLLDQIISQDIVNIVVNSSMDMNTFVNVHSSVAMNDSVNKCLELEAELLKQHNMVEKDEYNRLSKSFSKLEQHCISLEIAMQLNKEFFQKNDTSANQTEPTFDHLFELNNLKAELQAKDTTIEKLKANIKRLNKTSTTNNVKKDIDEIETINIELEHRVAKLIAENEYLKQTNKQLYDSIKLSRIRSKEHTESLVNQLNQKSVEVTDSNAQLQEKVSNATTIAPGMYKLNPVTLAPKDKNNRETHIYYLKHTIEQVAILREIVEQAKSLNPLDSASYSTCKYVKLIQELIGYVRDTCYDIHKPSEKLVAVTPINKKKTVSSMFDARHELCFLESVSDMNARRTFNLVGNVCPLTRITATNKVPLREPIPLEVVAQESVVTKVYTRRPKVPKTNGSNSKPKIAKSMISNKKEPSTSRGSNTSVAPSSSSLVDLRLSKLFCGMWTPDAQST